MLKLNASYSKKVPAEGEYSSQSYHASIEVELPDGLTQDQLQGRIHETFAMVRGSVEKDKPVEIILKAESVAKIKAVIKEIIQRKELTAEEKKEICEFIKIKAESEEMELMTPKSAVSEEKDNGEVKAA